MGGKVVAFLGALVCGAIFYATLFTLYAVTTEGVVALAGFPSMLIGVALPASLAFGPVCLLLFLLYRSLKWRGLPQYLVGFAFAAILEGLVLLWPVFMGNVLGLFAIIPHLAIFGGAVALSFWLIRRPDRDAANLNASA